MTKLDPDKYPELSKIFVEDDDKQIYVMLRAKKARIELLTMRISLDMRISGLETEHKLLLVAHQEALELARRLQEQLQVLQMGRSDTQPSMPSVDVEFPESERTSPASSAGRYSLLKGELERVVERLHKLEGKKKQ